MQCPKCENNVSIFRKVCKYCGYELCSNPEYVLEKTEQLIRKHDFIHATSFIDEALGYNPENPDLLHEKAVIYSYLWDYEKEYEYLEKALKISPKHRRTLYTLSKTLFTQGHYKKSLQYINRYLELEDNLDIYLMKIMSHYNLNNEEKSSETLKKALKLYPNNNDLLKLENIIKNSTTDELNFEKLSIIKLSSKKEDKKIKNTVTAEYSEDTEELYNLITPEIPSDTELNEFGLKNEIKNKKLYNINFEDLDILDSELNSKTERIKNKKHPNRFLKKLNRLIINKKLNRKSFNNLIYESFSNSSYMGSESYEFLRITGEYLKKGKISHNNLNTLNMMDSLEFYNYDEVLNRISKIMSKELENLCIYLTDMEEYDFDSLKLLVDLNTDKKISNEDFYNELKIYTHFDLKSFKIPIIN